MSERLDLFNKTLETVNKERQATYGHPSLHFKRVAIFKRVIADCPDPLARHALEMIADKIARLINDPTHTDSWIDVAGYARTGIMVTDKAE